MIQRFVTSNPSSAYVQAVSDAFKTGRDGKGIDPVCACDCWRVNHHRTTSIKPGILVWDSCWNRLLWRSHLQWRLRGSEGNYDGSAFAQRSTLPDQCKQRRVARAISQGDVELSNVLLRVHVSINVYKLLADDPNSLRVHHISRPEPASKVLDATEEDLENGKLKFTWWELIHLHEQHAIANTYLERVGFPMVVEENPMEIQWSLCVVDLEDWWKRPPTCRVSLMHAILVVTCACLPGNSFDAIHGVWGWKQQAHLHAKHHWCHWPIPLCLSNGLQLLLARIPARGLPTRPIWFRQSGVRSCVSQHSFILLLLLSSLLATKFENKLMRFWNHFLTNKFHMVPYQGSEGHSTLLFLPGRLGGSGIPDLYASQRLGLCEWHGVLNW